MNEENSMKHHFLIQMKIQKESILLGAGASASIGTLVTKVLLSALNGRVAARALL